MAMKKASGPQLKLDAWLPLKNKKQKELQTMLIKVKFLLHLQDLEWVINLEDFFEGQNQTSYRNEESTQDLCYQIKVCNLWL